MFILVTENLHTKQEEMTFGTEQQEIFIKFSCS